MSKFNLFGVIAVMLAVGLSDAIIARAQDITEFRNGHITFTNENPALYYRVEFKPNLTDPVGWDGAYRGLRNINSPNAEVTVPVGMFFRVVGRETPWVAGTASASDLLSGKTAYVDDEEVTGAMANNGQTNITPGTVAQTIPQGYHDGTGSVAGDADLVAGNIRAGVTLFGVAGTVLQATGNAVAGDVLSGKTFSNASGTNTGTIPVRTGDVPAISRYVSGTTLRLQPPPGYYSGSSSICVTFTDANFIPENIKYGVGIFGMGGTLKTAQVPKTGQTASYRTADDGDLEKGVAPPSPRFTDHGNGTVTDNMTGLMWTKNANLINGSLTWMNAVDYCNAMNSGSGTYGHTDWRLPNLRELQSLIDYGRYNPPLPEGHPFTNIVTMWYYWSSTTVADTTACAWLIRLNNGHLTYGNKTDVYCVWPVRAGQ